jgi:hypothetical protein
MALRPTQAWTITPEKQANRQRAKPADTPVNAFSAGADNFLDITRMPL